MKINISELVEAGVINSQTAADIEEFYKKKQHSSQNKLPIIFAIIGSVLTGLGIILLLAHNWDELSVWFRTCIGLLPLVASYAVCTYVIIKKNNSEPWSEGAGTFHFFTVGAAIGIISQIYHITGEPGGFELLWAVLALPMVYILNSTVTAGLYLIAITFFAAESGYASGDGFNGRYFVLLFAGVLPHLYSIVAKGRWRFHVFVISWILVFSAFIIVLSSEPWGRQMTPLALLVLFSILYLTGILLRERLPSWNGFLTGGTAGLYIMLFYFSFDSWWVVSAGFTNGSLVQIPDTLSATAIQPALIFVSGAVLYTILLFRLRSDVVYIRTLGSPVVLSFPLTVILMELALYDTVIPVVSINILILLAASLEIHRGMKQDSLSTLNTGLLLMLILITCRFFDVDISFVWRGLLFILAGGGFFAANYKIIQNRKRREVAE